MTEILCHGAVFHAQVSFLKIHIKGVNKQNNLAHPNIKAGTNPLLTQLRLSEHWNNKKLSYRRETARQLCTST